MDTSKIAICAETAYRCRVLFGFLASMTYITEYLLYTGAGLDLVTKMLISRPWNTALNRDHY